VRQRTEPAGNKGDDRLALPSCRAAMTQETRKQTGHDSLPLRPAVAHRTINVNFYTLEKAIMNQLRKYLSAAFVAVMLVTAVGCASTATQEGTGEYVDDSVITTKVKAVIFNEPTLKSSEINVETFKGIVQLSGFVSSQTSINKAIELSRHVAGVKSVKNDMQIK
jgi:dihydrodipicolinate synthase/N-acetylneuraminate lyase